MSVRWWVRLHEGEVTLADTSDLLAFHRFRNAALYQLGVTFAPMRVDDWYDMLDQALCPLREGSR
jgi:hypothetical protein